MQRKLSKNTNSTKVQHNIVKPLQRYNMTKYPKILIIGHTFNLRSGGGITLSNLFYGWKKSNIAVAAASIVNPSFEVCEKYYQLGSLEYKARFPFYLNANSNKIESGIVNTKELSDSINLLNKGGKSIFGIIYDKVLYSTGLIHYKRKFKVSDKFLHWIKDFSPDLIYTQLSSLEQIRLVDNLQKELKLPVAIHIMDDWPSTISYGYFPKLIWGKIINKEFLDLLSNSKCLFSISEAMSEEYLKRYSLRFIPFHNPIVVENWLPYTKIKWETEGAFKILYTGRIGRANGKAIIFMANIVNAMNLKENKITLDIYTPDFNTKNAASIKSLRGVNVRNTVPYNKMPALLASYDLLFLPLDFDKDGIRFAQMSMPTKTSEYMISGTPILVFADQKTALAKYAIRESWAYVVTENSEMVLMNAINELCSNLSLRMGLGEKAKKVAIQNEDAKIVRENFRRCLIVNSTKPDN